MRTTQNRLIPGVVILAMLCSGAVIAQDSAIEKAAKKQNLENVPEGAWQETWVNPDLDIHKYNKLLLWSAVYDFRDVPYHSSLSRQISRTTVFAISDEDRATFEEMVREAFHAEIVKGKHFTITETEGPGTILVRGAIADVISRVPPQQVGMQDNYLASVGEATLLMEFVDSETGEVLAVVAERGVISSSGGHISEYAPQRSSPAATRQAVQLWASNAGKKLRETLDSALSE